MVALQTAAVLWQPELCEALKRHVFKLCSVKANASVCVTWAEPGGNQGVCSAHLTKDRA